MEMYCGIDLHSNNCYLGIKNSEGKAVFGKRVKNKHELIIRALEPFKENIKGICVESTYNWYWLVDLFEENGYHVQLANPLAIQQYKGLKNANDKTDAFWLAEMLRLGILPTGYIYAKEMRPVRDLLRQRMKMVQQRTQSKLSLQSIFEREFGVAVSSSSILAGKHGVDDADIPECTQFRIDSMAKSICTFNEIILDIEDKVLSMVEHDDMYNDLTSIPGVGKILSMTIMLEVGDIERFENVRRFRSYSRCTDAKKVSNGKIKGQNLGKCGNKYLSWAFSEAATGCVRACEEARIFRDRKFKQKQLKVFANRALATKLCSSAFYIMKDKTQFSVEKCFGYKLDK